MSERFNNPGAGLPVEPSPGPVKPELPPAVHIQPPGVSKPFPDAKIKIETETESKFISSEALKNAAHLQAADRSYESLTVGSLKVIGDMDAGPIHSLHTHIQTVQGAQLKLSAEFSKIYQDLSSDGVISSAEKQILKKELEVIKAEYPIVIRKAEENKRADTEVAEYKRAYEKLISFLYDEIRIFDDMDKPLEIERGRFNGFFAAYYKARTALQVNKDGRDGSTKFLPSLETAGEYENQIGTYQGQLYRWTGSKWELLNAVMPLNPAVYYDFEAVSADMEKEGKKLKTAERKKTALNKRYNHAVQKTESTTNKISDLETQIQELKNEKERIERQLKYAILSAKEIEFLQNRLHTIKSTLLGLEYELEVCKETLKNDKKNEARAKKEKEAAEKAYDAVKFKEYKLLDVSGNKRHAVFNGIIKKEKTPAGTAFYFDGFTDLKREVTNLTGADKTWSHSRWVNLRKEDLLLYDGFDVSLFLWDYNIYDCCYIRDKCLFFTLLDDIDPPGGLPFAFGQTFNITVLTQIKNKSFYKKIFINNVLQLELGAYFGGGEEAYLKSTVYEKEFDMGCSSIAEDKMKNKGLRALGSEGSLSNFLIFERVLTEQEILWLYLNPQYPVKNYTLADWQIDAENGDSVLKDVVPKYLGVTETVPETEDVLIVKGEQLGKRKARAGDWVLMSRTVGGWEQGVCYRRADGQWIALKPEYRFTDCYQAALYHIFEIPELANKTGHFGALFAKVLVAQKAMVEFLSANKAFIEDLTANKTFIKKLTASKLEIDTDENSHYDFEAWFDSIHGLKINNEGKTIFSVSPKGDVFMKSDKLIVPVMDKDPSDIKVGEIWVRSDL